MNRQYFPVPGGMMSPSDLRQATWKAAAEGSKSLGIGWRQDLWWVPSAKDADGFPLTERQPASPAAPEDSPGRVLTSLWLAEILPGHSWYSTGLLTEIIRGLPPLPSGFCLELLDENLAGFHPVLGNLRFLATPQPHLWELKLNLKGEVFLWPLKVDSQDIGALVRALLDSWEADTPEALASLAGAPLKRGHRKEDVSGNAGDWEGWSPIERRSWGLHIYRTNHEYPLDFLQALAKTAESQNIGRFFLSPWGGLTILGISEASRPLWNRVLSEHAISLRHGSPRWVVFQAGEDPTLFLGRKALETHWEAEDRRCENHVVVLTDLSRLQVEAETTLIKKTSGDGWALLVPGEPTRFLETSEELADNLIPSSQKSAAKDSLEGAAPAPDLPLGLQPWRCGECGGAYDPAYGDPSQAIPPGVDFASLPEAYACPCCGAPREKFALGNEPAAVIS